MFFTYLDKLKRQPESVRKKYTLFFTIMITGIIVCIYLFSLYLHSLGTRTTKKALDEERREKSTEEIFNQSNQFLNSTDY